MGEALNFESENGRWSHTNQPFEWRNYRNDKISANDFKDKFNEVIKPCGMLSYLSTKLYLTLS